jgi:hypothetical protein
VPIKRQVDVAKLRKELAKAVEAEDYERPPSCATRSPGGRREMS